ncbi:MAG TPA: DUF6262 family protein [Pseudonocardiaceae bacterium]|jgi:hypothetical protein
MPADRATRLAQLARARHEQTLQRAHAALTTMASNGDTITVSLLASKAGVSRSWIYTQPELRDQIKQLPRPMARTGAPRREAGDPASEESLRRRLALAHQRIAELRDENQQLRQSLAHAHGQRRATDGTLKRNGDGEGSR